MRVAYVITRADAIGGAQIHLLHLGAALKRLGHEPFVITGKGEVFTRELEAEDIPYHSVPHLDRVIRPWKDARTVLELVRALKQVRPDILSAHSSKAGILGRIAGRRLGLPTLFTAHGWAFAEGVRPLPRFLYREAERLAAPLADRIVTVSEADRRLAVRHRVASPDRLVTIRNGVPDVPPGALADPGPDGCTIVTVARLEPQKDVQLLLRTLARLTNHAWTLRVVGDGPLRSSLERSGEELGIDDRVEFLGYRRDVPDVLARGQAFALPSRQEGLPRAILEAMRAGLPVIASDVGGIREAVHHGSTGFVIQDEEPDGWLNPLRTLIGDPRLRARMGEAGRRRYVKYFTLNRMLDETLDLYRQLRTTHTAHPAEEGPASKNLPPQPE